MSRGPTEPVPACFQPGLEFFGGQIQGDRSLEKPQCQIQVI